VFVALALLVRWKRDARRMLIAARS